jgi:hypothetical protein
MVASIVGNTGSWKKDLFPDALIPDMLELVVETWKIFKKPNRLDHEVPISKEFVKKLQAKKNRQGDLPFKIRPELVVYGDEDGRMDICFDYIGTPREDIYFAFECKRLRIPYPPPSKLATNNSDYVGDQGMMCFVTGKYGGSVTNGGMIGYVMDGKVSPAITSVGKLIKSKQAGLKLSRNTGLESSSLLPHFKNIKETKHAFGKKKFTIHHVFLAV